jgi:hypothetical protein
MKKLLIVLALSVVAVFAANTPSSQYGSATFAWTLSSGNNITNYTIWYGIQSGIYTNSVNVGTNTQGTVGNLVRGVTYFAAATATDNIGVTSPYSNEASVTINQVPGAPQSFHLINQQ